MCLINNPLCRSLATFPQQNPAQSHLPQKQQKSIIPKLSPPVALPTKISNITRRSEDFTKLLPWLSQGRSRTRLSLPENQLPKWRRMIQSLKVKMVYRKTILFLWIWMMPVFLSVTSENGSYKSEISELMRQTKSSCSYSNLCRWIYV